MVNLIKIVWLLHISTLVFFMGGMIASPIISPYALSLGADAVLIGLLSSISSAVTIILRPFVGLIVDRGKKFETLILGTLLSCVAAIIYFMSNNVFMFAIGRIMSGLAAAFFMPASISTAIDLSPSDRIGETLGWRSTMFGVSQFLGPGVGGYLADLIGLRYIFIISFFFVFIALILVYYVSRLAPKETIKYSKSSNELKDIKKLLKVNFIGGMLAVIFHSMAISGVGTFLPAYYVSIGLGISIYGFYSSINGGASIITRAISGRIADKHGPILVASIGAITITSGYVILNISPFPPLAFLAAILVGIGTGLWVPAIQLLALGNLPREIRGFGSGIYSIAFDAGFLIGPLMFGFMISFMGSYSVFLWILPILTFLAFLTVQFTGLIMRKTLFQFKKYT
ncbi:MAG: MFS transporter [Candidatus Methanomethylicia archaeon]|nr:MFS transporter [Candidatus Methanomethylicia archaeon]MCX8168944.1 MFS transporter [Candidatus Methanomethylicia archaeon]MDW7988676.1 MFS transporter [Nitrososphaerota archaeon]